MSSARILPSIWQRKRSKTHLTPQMQPPAASDTRVDTFLQPLDTFRKHQLRIMVNHPQIQSSKLAVVKTTLHRRHRTGRRRPATVVWSSNMAACESTSSITTMRRVRFSDMSSLIIYPYQPPLQGDGTWHTRSQSSAFKRQVVRDVIALRKSPSRAYCDAHQERLEKMSISSPELAGVHCVRGLEHLLSPSVTKQITIRRQKVIERVLQEQEAQRAVGRTDTARIREVSMRNGGEWSLIEAIARAK